MVQQELKPFSVKSGKEATNWWAELTILKELKEKGKDNWTEEEKEKYFELVGLSASWVTCACGNQCSIIPRLGINGMPKDSALASDGQEFYNNVASLEVDKAVSTLERIEKRSEELIKQILKEQTK